ncbi:unnamed protein product [Schistocephalus solidus]|uniref:Rab-GAP TBC domain-containing protein n=1 Tax=Schistocephalus solidus TaxID=70667 RepID=A0A183TQ62_SCHSO|nr:unnamed protein product [Schistocephalus solidus]
MYTFPSGVGVDVGAWDVRVAQAAAAPFDGTVPARMRTSSLLVCRYRIVSLVAVVCAVACACDLGVLAYPVLFSSPPSALQSLTSNSGDAGDGSGCDDGCGDGGDGGCGSGGFSDDHGAGGGDGCCGNASLLVLRRANSNNRKYSVGFYTSYFLMAPFLLAFLSWHSFQQDFPIPYIGIADAKELTRRVFKGIPPPIRTKMWPKLLRVQQAMRPNVYKV